MRIASMTPTEQDNELREAILLEFKNVHRLAPADYTENCTNIVMQLITADRKRVALEARIQGIEEAHKEILSIVFTYTHHEEPNFCDVDDVSRVAMSWKVKRIAELKAQQEEV